jgi:hypothetical protein
MKTLKNTEMALHVLAYNTKRVHAPAFVMR